MEEEATRKEYEEMNSWSCVVLRFCAVFFCVKKRSDQIFLSPPEQQKARALPPAFMHGEEAGGRSVGPTDGVVFCRPIRFEYFTT